MHHQFRRLSAPHFVHLLIVLTPLVLPGPTATASWIDDLPDTEDGDTLFVEAGTYVLTEQLEMNPGAVLLSVSGKASTILQVHPDSSARHISISFGNSVPENTTTIGGPGAGFTFSGGQPTLAEHGGAVKLSGDTITVRIEDCAFLKSQVLGGYGGAIYAKSDKPGSNGSLSLELVDCSFDSNSVAYSSSAHGAVYGGALYIQNATSNTSVTRCSFTGNFATGGPAYNWATGGAVHWYESFGTFSDNTLIGNHALSGGAFHQWAQGSPALPTEFRGNLFEDNVADTLGGALFLDHFDWITPIAECEFISNEAGITGGAVYNAHNDVDLRSCLFSENESTEGSGGALWIGGGTTCLERCLLRDNEAGGNGGAVYYLRVGSVGEPDSAEWDNVTLVGNEACGNGGGIYLAGLDRPDGDDDDLTLYMHNSLIFGNSATRGTGIYESTSDSLDVTYGCIVHDMPMDTCWSHEECADCDSTDDPLFCDAENGDYTIWSDSPAAPGETSDCGLIGSEEVGCGILSVYPVEDTEISEGYMIGYFYDGDTLRVGSVEDDAFSTVLHFQKSQFTSIPGSMEIAEVYLELAPIPDCIQGEPKVALFESRRIGTIMSQTSWNTWRTGYPWGEAGAKDTSLDYVPDTLAFSDGEFVEWEYNRLGSRAAMKEWFENNLWNCLNCYYNQFIILHPCTEGTDEVGFGSKDQDWMPPRLTIEYNPPPQ